MVHNCFEKVGNGSGEQLDGFICDDLCKCTDSRKGEQITLQRTSCGVEDLTSRTCASNVLSFGSHFII